MTNFYHSHIKAGVIWAGLFRPYLCILVFLQLLVSCDIETLDLGSVTNVDGVVSQQDWIATTTGRFEATTSTTLLGAVRANSHKCYLGRIADADKDDAGNAVVVEAEYITQLHCFEGSSFPAFANLVSKKDGLAVCDSVCVLIYYDSWYGDTDAPLKVSVTPLNSSVQLPGNSMFYTDVDLDQYSVGNTPVASNVFTIMDHTFTDNELNSSTHAHCARIKLPDSFGDAIIQKYYSHPNYFADSYTFARNVCAGFRFNLVSGSGAMMAVNATSLNIYYSYKATGSKDKLDGATTFVGSAEVVQATHFNIENLDKLTANTDYTYVSSPAGMATEMELPVNEIMANHQSDSLAKVQIVLMRHQSGITVSEGAFDAPSTLGMILKSEQSAFFAPGYELNANKFASASFSSTYNCYDFANIARVVSYMYNTKLNGMKSEGKDEATWENDNPDWNHVVLMPVTINTNKMAGTVVSVLNDMSLTKARLVGGKKSKIDVNVIYNKYK